MTKYVLSVDGGGIRGVIAAKVLCEIEKRINRPLGEVFDLFVGSSVGSIIVAGLAFRDDKGGFKYTASDILGFFHKFGPKIFSTSAVKKVLSVVCGSRISPNNLEKALRLFFGKSTMGDIPAKFMSPTYDVRMQEAHIMRNWVDKYKALHIVDVLRAASAAPTIFPPKKVAINGERCILVDSGLVANNPAVCGAAAADFLYKGEDVCFLSIGSGDPRHQHMEIKDNLIFWAQNVAQIFLDAGMETVDYQMNRMVGDEKYIRITGELRKASHDFTDATARNIKALCDDADRIIAENISGIERFVAMVRKR
ncbi:patatin-like phospholipase family protein [Anaplasma bovis]|uniref:patatin-like phospholipase family protein n=1 Tax=Anaplasma bovis TaxID=186733 RepID=UPI002FEF8461